VEQVSGIGEQERLYIRQPLEEQFLSVMKARITILAYDAKNGLFDLTCLVWPERPLAQRWQFMAEESVGVSSRLLHGARNSIF
jgi:hypothetical protein